MAPSYSRKATSIYAATCSLVIPPPPDSSLLTYHATSNVQKSLKLFFIAFLLMGKLGVNNYKGNCSSFIFKNVTQAQRRKRSLWGEGQKFELDHATRCVCVGTVSQKQKIKKSSLTLKSLHLICPHSHIQYIPDGMFIYVYFKLHSRCVIIIYTRLWRRRAAWK